MLLVSTVNLVLLLVISNGVKPNYIPSGILHRIKFYGFMVSGRRAKLTGIQKSYGTVQFRLHTHVCVPAHLPHVKL